MAAISSMQKDQLERAAKAADTGDFSKLYLLSSTDAQMAAALLVLIPGITPQNCSGSA
jgi:hypothetical protein